MSRRERDSFNEINITPLTDIFLVLLVMMMVIAPLLDQQGLSLAVPNNVEVQDIKKESKLISVLVTDNDTYIADENEINILDMSNYIKQKLPTHTDGLLILSEPEASHGALVKLMDIARNAGVNSITVSEL